MTNTERIVTTKEQTKNNKEHMGNVKNENSTKE